MERTISSDAIAIPAASALAEAKCALLDTVQLSERRMKIGAKEDGGVPSTRVLLVYVHIFLLAVGVVLGESTAQHDSSSTVQRCREGRSNDLRTGVLMQGPDDRRRVCLSRSSPG